MISKGIYILTEEHLKKMLKQAYKDAQNRTEFNFDILSKEFNK